MAQTLPLEGNDMGNSLEELGGYIGLILTGIAAIGLWYNRMRRDNSQTNLQQRADSAAGLFVGDLVSDHRRLVDQLRETSEERIINAEKLGALTAEVTTLRTTVAEVKALLIVLTGKLEEANTNVITFERELYQKDSLLSQVTLEKEAAIRRAMDAEEALATLRGSLEL